MLMERRAIEMKLQEFFQFPGLAHEIMQCIAAAPARAQCFLPLFRTSHENSDNLLPPFVEEVRELAGAAANLSKSVGDEEPPFLPDFDPCLPLPFPGPALCP